ncbi:MAG TPA: hypothetical protein VMI56_01075 [Reyranella sp.]|nr:hypothetical protein [Reyranella sp.]
MQQKPVDRKEVQHLDPVRAVYRPANPAGVSPSLVPFVGREDLFRRVGEVEVPGQGRQIMMQCPLHWPVPDGWLPLSDLDVLEILEDQDIRAG